MSRSASFSGGERRISTNRGVEVLQDEVAVVEEDADRSLLEERAVALLRLAQGLRDVVLHRHSPRLDDS